MRRSIFASVLVVALIGLSNLLMAQDSGLWLITRTHAEFRDWQDGIWGKTCDEVRGDSILGFFQRLWRELPPLPEDYFDRDRDDPDAVTLWFRGNMGEHYPHALTGLAEAIHVDEVPMPTTEAELVEALATAMWWAPNSDGIRLSPTCLRVALDESVFLLATADEVAQNPQVWSFPMWGERSLPDASGPKRKVVVPEHVRRLLPAGSGEGWVYASCSGVEGTRLQPRHDGPQWRPAGSL